MRGVKRIEGLVWLYAAVLLAFMLFWPVLGRWAYWVFFALAIPVVLYSVVELVRGRVRWKEGAERDAVLMSLVVLAFVVIGFNAQPISERSPQSASLQGR
jgi:cation transport ATPase